MSPYTEDCNFSFPCKLASPALLGQEVFSSLMTMAHMLLQTRTTPHLPAEALLVLLYFLFSQPFLYSAAPLVFSHRSTPRAFPSQHPLCFPSLLFAEPWCSYIAEDS